jgi:thioredoxin 1
MKQLTSAESLDDLLTQHECSLLLFSASWCGPCKSMTSVVEGLADVMNDRLNIIKVDVDISANDASDYGIRSVPTLMLVKHDEIIAQQMGALSPQDFAQWLEQNI